MGLRFKSATLAENIGHLLKIMFCKNEIVLIITLNYSSLNYIFLIFFFNCVMLFRLPQPDMATNDVYDYMLKCWEHNVQDRYCGWLG